MPMTATATTPLTTALPTRRRDQHRTPAFITKMILPLVVIAVIVGVAAFVYLGKGKDNNSPQATLDEAVVERMGFEITTVATGELESRNQLEIRNPIESRTTITFIVDEGTTVQKGDLLVKLNAEALETQIADQEIQVSSARADLDAAESEYEIQLKTNAADLQDAQLRLQLAELSLSQWEQGELVQRIQDNDLAVEEAQRQLARAEDRFEQTVQLHAQGFESADRLKEDEISLLRTRADLTKAELSRRIYHEFQRPKDEAQKRSDVDKARDELVRVQAQNEIRINTRRVVMENRRQQLNVRQTRLARTIEQFEASTIYAPAPGLVVYQTSVDRGRGGDNPLQVGTEVFPNQLLVILPDTSQMRASVRVHESLAGRIREGQQATIRIDAAAGLELPGRVTSIGVLAETGGWRDPNLREYRVNIFLDESARPQGSAQLRPSMRCEARITLGRVEDALTIPVQAVFNEGVLRYVHVREGQMFVRRPVNLGRRSDTHAEVTAGLNPGDRVLLRDPQPGEVLGRPWDATELASVGLRLDEQGNIVRAASATAAAAAPRTRTADGAAPSAAAPASAAPATTQPVNNRNQRHTQPASSSSASPAADQSASAAATTEEPAATDATPTADTSDEDTNSETDKDAAPASTEPATTADPS